MFQVGASAEDLPKQSEIKTNKFASKSKSEANLHPQIDVIFTSIHCGFGLLKRQCPSLSAYKFFWLLDHKWGEGHSVHHKFKWYENSENVSSRTTRYSNSKAYRVSRWCSCFRKKIARVKVKQVIQIHFFSQAWKLEEKNKELSDVLKKARNNMHLLVLIAPDIIFVGQLEKVVGRRATTVTHLKWFC